jgi:hypothetical protein
MTAEPAAPAADRPPLKLDGAQVQVRLQVDKFHADIGPYEAQYGREEGLRRFLDDHRPYETDEAGGNLLMTLGADFIIDQLITGGTTGIFNGTNTHLGVGDSTTAAAAGQTDLQAATNKFRKVVSGAPSHTDGTNSVQWVAAFATGEANFAWAEWGIFNASSSGLMLSRKVEALGTKASGTWTLTVTWSIS